jgi:hypothetical protein
MEHAARYAKERRQFGKPIAEFQAVQFTLAEMATEIEAASLMVYNAARLKDAGKPYVKEAAMAKLFASQVAERVASQCVEVFGGNGFVRDYPIEKYYRDAKIGKIYEGTSNMQLATIAKQVLKHRANRRARRLWTASRFIPTRSKPWACLIFQLRVTPLGIHLQRHRLLPAVAKNRHRHRLLPWLARSARSQSAVVAMPSEPTFRITSKAFNPAASAWLLRAICLIIKPPWTPR